MSEVVESNLADEKPVEAKSTEDKSTAQEQPKSILSRAIRFMLVNFAVIPALLTIAGFFVIHSYLASFTHLFTYNISLSQYLAAGMNLIIGLLAYFFPPVVAGVSAAVCLIPLAIIVFIIGLGMYIGDAPKEAMEAQVNKVVQRSGRVISVLYPLSKFILRLGIIIAIVYISLEYGQTQYGKSPRMFGGGEPAEVVLIFKDADLLVGLSLPTSNNSPRQTEPVEYLMELMDGILVRYKPTNTLMIVKNDVLQAVVDANPPVKFAYPTPTPVPSSTPTLVSTSPATPILSVTPTP